MNISGNTFGVDAFETGELDLFADTGYLIVDLIRDAGAIELNSEEFVEGLNIPFNGGGYDALGEGYEICILGNEVCLTGQGDDKPCLVIGSGGCDDHTFLCFTVATQSGYFLAFFTQVVDGFFEIA